MSKTYKVAYNGCYGGFGLSLEAVKLAKSYAGEESPWHNVDEEYCYIDEREISRHDPILIRVIEELGTASASGMCAELIVAEIDTPLYRIDEYDGYESVEKPGDVYWINAEES